MFPQNKLANKLLIPKNFNGINTSNKSVDQKEASIAGNLLQFIEIPNEFLLKNCVGNIY